MPYFMYAFFGLNFILFSTPDLCGSHTTTLFTPVELHSDAIMEAASHTTAALSIQACKHGQNHMLKLNAGSEQFGGKKKEFCDFQHGTINKIKTRWVASFSLQKTDVETFVCQTIFALIVSACSCL